MLYVQVIYTVAIIILISSQSSPNTAPEGQSSPETMEILPNNRESGGGVRWLSDETNTNMGRKKDVYMKVVMGQQ